MSVLAIVVAGGAISVPAAGAFTWNVSNVSQLNSAISGQSPGDEIIIAPGTYNLTRVVAMNTPNVSIRGATGNRDDVILVGGGMNTRGVDEGITIGADDITVRNLTLKDFYFNALHVRAENDADRAVISNVKTWNIGERHIKGSRNASNLSATSDDMLIENVFMLQTIPRTGHPDTSPDYIGGMDLMSTNNIIIRDNLAVGICGQTGEGNASIFLWQGHNNATIERNVIIGTNKGIGIGLTYYAGPTISGGWHADGGVIRNNFILRGDGTGGNNIGMELCLVKNMDVVNNTVYSPNAGYFRTLSIWEDATYTNDNLEIVNNIVRGGAWYNGGNADAAVAAMGNIVDRQGTVVVPGWFVDALNGDLHLTELATAAFDAGDTLADVPFDIDGGPRPAEGGYDMGADEYASPMGDATRDGSVNLLDLTILAGNWQQSGKNWGDGDFNRSGDVNLLDLTLLAGNWGFPGAAGEQAAVPEPVALALLAVGGCALIRRRRRA